MQITAITRRKFVKAGAAVGALVASGSLSSPAVRAAARTLRIGYVSPQTGPLAGFAEADSYILGGVRPIPAIRKLLDKVGWSVGDVDLFEINEAFAVVAMAAQKDLGIPRDRLNVNGGACALGHPIGATGARLIVTLLHALQAHNLKRGVAALCIGGGEATAIAVERVAH